MKIAICDDEMCFVEEILERIKNYGINDVFTNQFHTYLNPDDLLNQFKMFKYDLVYLDIEFNNRNGIDIAYEIKKIKPKCMIIFVTCHDKFVHDAYKVDAFQYINKPIDPVLFDEELERAIRKYKTLNKTIVFNVQSNMKAVKTSDIVYLKTHYNEYHLHLINGESYTGEARAVIKAREELTNNHFFQLNRSYLINLSHVVSFNTDSVTMANDDVLPLTKRRRQGFKKFYYDFIDMEDRK